MKKYIVIKEFVGIDTRHEVNDEIELDDKRAASLLKRKCIKPIKEKATENRDNKKD